MGEDNPSGYGEQYSTDAVREVFDEYPRQVITARDVKDTLGCSIETARRKLEILEAAGVVKKRKTGRTVLWRPEESEESEEAENDE